MCDHEHDLREIRRALDRIESTQGEVMAGQASIDAAVSQFATTQASQSQQLSALQADVDAIKALVASGGSAVDTGALDSAVAAQQVSDAAMADGVAAVGAAIPPAPPAP